jgi:hypothetical protein
VIVRCPQPQHDPSCGGDSDDATADPRWEIGPGRLRALFAYGRKVYHLGERFDAISDGRREPVTPAPLIARSIHATGMLRLRSLNALEPRLGEAQFKRLIGARPGSGRVCSADTVARSLVTMKHEPVRQVSISTVAQAERNKVFREGWHGALRYAALDGWEPFSSYNRCCDHCLVRHVKVKQPDGSVREVEQYFHSYVVALMIDEWYDLFLDLEPLLPRDLLEEQAVRDGRHEGELSAAKRLLPRVKRTFPWLDVVVADSLYANGPFLTLAGQLRMGAIVIAKKEKDEPLKEALDIWGDSPPHQVIDDREAHERLELWDCPGVQTLSSYKGPIRVVRARVTKTGTEKHDEEAPTRGAREGSPCSTANAVRHQSSRPSQRRLRKRNKQSGAPTPTTWCMLVTGKAASLSAPRVVRVGRGRWHEELTGFHQWTKRWRFGHVFVHHGAAIVNLFWLFLAAYNLLTLFLYRQDRSYGRARGKDVTRTISRFVDILNDDLARLDVEIWGFA